jgi:uncharacterized membrane protein
MRYKDLTIIAVLNTLVLLLAALGQFPPLSLPGMLRIALGALYLVFAPGYALLAALLPFPRQISTLNRLTLAVGLSLAVTPILGLALNDVPGGISLWSSLVFLSSLTGLSLTVASLRRWNFVRAQPTAHLAETRPRAAVEEQQFRLDGGSLLVVAAVLVGLAILLYVLTAPTPEKQFTEFSLLGPDGLAEEYPLSAVAGQALTLSAGLANHEGRAMTYTLTATVAGQPVSPPQSLTVADGAAQTLVVPVTFAASGQKQLLELALTVDGQVYRRLYLYVDVSAP